MRGPRVCSEATFPGLSTVTPCLRSRLQRFASALDVPLYRLFYTEEDGATACGGQPQAILEELAQTEGNEARFLLQLKGLVGSLVDADRAFLLDCARKLASH